MSRIQTVDELMKQYVLDPKNKELEIRIKYCDYVDTLKKLETVQYEHLLFLETTKYGDNSKKSIRITYDSKKDKITKVAYKKRRMFYYIADLYSVNISEELDDPDISLSYRPDKVLFKNRFSFNHLLSKDWRVDITLDMEMENINSITRNDIIAYFKQNEDFIGLKKSIAKNPQRYSCSIEIEYIGNPAGDLKLPSIYVFDTKLSGGAEKNEYMICLKNVSKLLESNEFIRDKKTIEPTIKFLLPQVKDLTKITYMDGVYPPTNYMITDKADGLRSLVYITETSLNILNKSYSHTALSETMRITIMDCELVKNALLIFDVMYVNGNNVMEMGIEKRITFAPDIAAKLNTIQKEYEFRMKIYNSLTIRDKYRDAFTEAMKEVDEYKKDGIIMVSKQKPYYETITYKWKDVKHQTFDMLSVKAPEHLTTHIDKVEGFDIYFLFCGISVAHLMNLNIRLLDGYADIFPNVNTKIDRLIPVQFALSYYPKSYVLYFPKKKEINIHMKVIELRISSLNISNGIYINWRYVQTREDRPIIPNRYYGNAYKTVMNIFMNYIDPFPLEVLINGFDDDNYFVSVKNSMYAAYTGFMSYAKEQTMRDFIPKNTVVMDVGAGKGQDIFRYNKIGVKSILAIDKDSTAIVRLLNRWMDFYMYNRNPTVTLRTTLHTIVLDMNTDFNVNVEQITCKFNQKYDVIVCNLAIHYFLESIVSMKNFINFCNAIIADTGIIIVTCLSGAKIFNKVMETGKYELSESDVVKFSIKKMFNDTTLESSGQRIDVLLPFSNNKYYTEFLVNIDVLKSEFQNKAFDIVYEKCMSDMLEHFRQVNPSVYDKLNSIDKEYIDLFHALVFKKST